MTSHAVAACMRSSITPCMCSLHTRACASPAMRVHLQQSACASPAAAMRPAGMNFLVLTNRCPMVPVCNPKLPWRYALNGWVTCSSHQHPVTAQPGKRRSACIEVTIPSIQYRAAKSTCRGGARLLLKANYFRNHPPTSGLAFRHALAKA